MEKVKGSKSGTTPDKDADNGKYSATFVTNILNYIQRNLSHIKSIHLGYALDKNVARIQSELQAFSNRFEKLDKKWDNDAKAYDKKRRRIFEIYMDTDNPPADGQVNIYKDIPMAVRMAFLNELDDLDGKYAKFLEAQRILNETNEEIAGTRAIDIDFYELPTQYLPDTLSQVDLKILRPLINQEALEKKLFGSEQDGGGGKDAAKEKAVKKKRGRKGS